MKPLDPSERAAEVLRLGLVEGASVRAIAKRLGMARKTVRKILGRHCTPPKPAAEPRGSILDSYEAAIRLVLDDAPEMLAPAVLERLRPLGYSGGVTILRDRLRRLRPRQHREAFLTLDFAPGEAKRIEPRVASAPRARVRAARRCPSGPQRRPERGPRQGRSRQLAALNRLAQTRPGHADLRRLA
jgi:transposase